MKGGGFVGARMMRTAMAVGISMLMCVFVTGCPEVIDESLGWRKFPPLAKDRDGDMPDDVVRHFFEAARSNDYVRAQSYWFGESKRISVEIPFHEFCKEYQELEKYTIDKPVTGKPGVYIVYWHGVATNGAVINSCEGLENVNGYWRIIRGYNW